MQYDAVVIYCTCPDEDVAGHIAAVLVGEGLAACVNSISGVTSTYLWDGRVHRDDEVLLIIKTRAARVDDLASRISSLHPYELPEIIAVPVSGGSHAYLDWISRSTDTRKA